MRKEQEYGTKLRLLRIQRAILESPFRYTKTQLSNLYNCSKSTISRDFDTLRNAGYSLEKDQKHRYAFIQEKPIKSLKGILHFSEEERMILNEAIDHVPIHSGKGERLKQKLESLYDFHKLGFSYLRKPYLSKLDSLENAMRMQKQVILIDYSSSNSNIVKDRKVEPFHISPPDDTVQAYDVGKKALRHFRISRIKRVENTEENWQHAGHHVIMKTDVFRIVDNEQELAEILLRVGGKNELIERYPLTKSWIEPGDHPDTFHFQSKVNHRFLGLSNFILGFHHQVIEIVGPDSLKQHLNESIKKLRY